MKIIKLAVASLLLAAFGSASAVTILTDTVNGNNFKVTASTPKSYQHLITDNGYVLGSDTIDSAILTLTLFDGVDQGNEQYQFVFGEFGVTQTVNGVNIPNGSANQVLDYPFTSGTNALAALIANGFLDVTLSTSRQGSSNPNNIPDYTFVSSVLNVTMKEVIIEPAPGDVPEPASLALLGLGLLGVGVARRRRSK